jgi:prophage regulatory protein
MWRCWVPSGRFWKQHLAATQFGLKSVRELTDAGQEPQMTQPNDRMLRIKTVLDRTGLSRSTLYRKIDRGEFPKQVKLSERCAGWRESAIEAWLRNPMFYSTQD